MKHVGVTKMIDDLLDRKTFPRHLMLPSQCDPDEFIRLYYKLLPVFTYFIQKDEYRADLLTLLSGDVYDRADAPVLQRIRDFIEHVESSDSHILKDALTDMPIN